MWQSLAGHLTYPGSLTNAMPDKAVRNPLRLGWQVVSENSFGQPSEKSTNHPSTLSQYHRNMTDANDVFSRVSHDWHAS